MNIIYKKFLLLLIIIITLCNSCLFREVTYDAALTMLPETTREMKTSGFWISMHNNPDKVLLTENQITQLNSIIEKDIDSAKNILLLEDLIDGNNLKKQIESYYVYISKSKLFFDNGKKPDKDFYEKIIENIDLENIPEKIDVQYGLIKKYANQRVLPSDKLLNDIPGELFFDALQMSALDIATPIVVLHKTKDNEWCFVKSPRTDGWIKTDNITLCTKKQLNNYLNKKLFVVVTNPKCEIYLDEKLTDYYDYARMGVYFPLIEKSNNQVVEIIIPYFDSNFNFFEKKAYINKDDINYGFLKYTPRNIINQAFKLINTPYGWGGMFGEQDCSKFLYEILSCVGIYLPRNSSVQSTIGEIIVDLKKTDDYNAEEKLKIIKEQCIPGISFLRLPGHIMLYLGWFNEKPYVIHSTWGYREKLPAKERVRLINRVTVSDLSLGQGTKKGSLLQRINRINNVLLKE